MTAGPPGDDSSPHRFGGSWTDRKLRIISDYLSAYSQVLRKQPFQLAYIDAFAGSGYRTPSRPALRDATAPELEFPDLAEEEPQALLAGSAARALEIRSFDRYIFIERDARRCAELEALRTQFPVCGDKIVVIQGEANREVRAFCGRMRPLDRAVLFLDPYGMQVEWTTIEAIAATRAIDLWVLFPLGVAVNRLVTKSGKIRSSWRKRLDLTFGTQEWSHRLYRSESTPTLFESEEVNLVKAPMEEIGRYYGERLRSVFAGTAKNPAVLRNSRNNPLYLLCFAVGNERGKGPALRIANHLLREMD